MKFKKYAVLIIFVIFALGSLVILNETNPTIANNTNVSSNIDGELINTDEDTNYQNDEEKYDGLRILVKRSSTLNPLLSNDEILCKALGLVYQNIVSFTKDDKVQYNLIDSCTFSPENNEFVITIKPDMLWDDGQPITVDDFVYSYNLLRNAPENAYYKNVIQDITSFKKINNTQISIRTSKAYAGNPYFLAFPIVPEHKKNTLDLSDKVHYNLIVGNGVYKNVQNDVNNIVYLEDNPTDDKNPFIKNVQLVPTENNESLYYGFEQGLANVLVSTVASWSNYHVDKNVNINSYNNMEMVTLGFNFNTPINQDINFRNAVYYSIPFEQIQRSIYLGYCDSSRTLYPDNHFAFNKDIVNEKYDALIAQKYYKLSSYGGQTLKLITLKDNQELIKTSELIKNNLSNIGINIEVVPLSFEEYKTAVSEGNYDLYLGKFKMSVLPDFTKIIGENNYSNYENETVVDLLNSLNTSTSYEQYAQTANTLENTIFTQKPVIPIVHTHDAIISSSYVTTQVPNSYNTPYMDVETWQMN